MKLCVNVDHIATLRQARRGVEPDPVWGAVLCILGGADGITFHLREDRRHIQDRDVKLLRELISAKLNMEMAPVDEIKEIALRIRPDQVTLVPERREEITTEGGLDVNGNLNKIKTMVEEFRAAGILVSLFINPDRIQIDASKDAGADSIEIHTGEYANAYGRSSTGEELEKIRASSSYAHSLGLKVFAGHGLNYQNVKEIVKVPYIEELNIGHSIVSRAIFVGIKEAVREMVELLVGRD